VVKITAECPRTRMFELFRDKWAMQYDEPPPMDYFPKGITDISNY
jgi:hypothetical protein